MTSVVKYRGGYILVETVVALALLGIGSFAVHGTIQQAVQTRGQAQDYTRARFLLEGLVAGVELEPEMDSFRREGRFEGVDDRFSWELRVSRVDVPKPARPLRPPPKGVKQKPLRYVDFYSYLARAQATVTWTRGGREFSERYETLIGPDQLWQPPRPGRAGR